MSRHLTGRTLVRHPDTGAPTVLHAGDPLPEWAGGLVDEHLLDGELDLQLHLPPGSELKEPAGNASEADWRAHAIARGIPEDEAADLKRDQLKERVAALPPASPPPAS